MLEPVLIGLVAATLTVLPSHIRAFFPGFTWQSPLMVLGVAAAAMLLQRFVIYRRPGNRNYDGVSDLMIHIHSPGDPDSATRWGVRGLISLLLSLFGTAVGPEGAAAEFAHAGAM